MYKSMHKTFIVLLLLLIVNSGYTQVSKDVIDQIIKEVYQNSQLKPMAHELLDGIGPRLVGTPKMKQANDWAVSKYTNWGINARNEQWGNGADGTEASSHIDMVSSKSKIA